MSGQAGLSKDWQKQSKKHLWVHPGGQHLSPTSLLQKLDCMVYPSTTQPSVHLSFQLIVAEKEQEASPLVPCSSSPWSHHAHGPSSSPCMGHREGNKTGFTREIPEHKQQLTTYPDKVSLTLSSSSFSSSSSWQANKQKPTMTSHCMGRPLPGVRLGCSEPIWPLHKTVTPQAQYKGFPQAVGERLECWAAGTL